MARPTKTRSKEALQAYREKCRRIASNTSINPLEDEQAKLARIALLKKDYKACVAYYFPEYAEAPTPRFHIRHAKRMLKTKRIRIWTKWPRAHAKSVVNNLLIPFWLWINDDINFMVIVGENADKASLLLDDLRAEFESNQRIIHDFGGQKTHGDWSETSFRTKNGFIAKSLGMGQSPRGIRVKNRRPDYISCDDWENEQTENNPKRQGRLAKWLLKALIPTMDTGNRRIVISQNHYAFNMIFKIITDGNANWIVDRVNAFNPETFESISWPEKYDADHWHDVVDEITMVIAQAEYNHEPYVEGKEFTEELIQWGKLPSLSKMTAIIGIWDVAYSNSPTADFNAVRVWGKYQGKKYLIDCYVKRSKMKSAIRWIADFQKTHGVSIQFRYESQFWNEELQRNIAEVEQETGQKLNLIKMVRSTVNKFLRIMTMLPHYHNNRVIYNEKLKSHNDTQEGLNQLKGIEPGYSGKDDAPDADQYAFDYLDRFEKTNAAPAMMKHRESRSY